MKVVEAIEALLSLPNLENRVGPWRDVIEAVRQLQDAYAQMKADGIRLIYLNPPVPAPPFVIEDDE